MKLKFTTHQKKYINKNAQYWIQTLHDNEVGQCKGTLEDEHGFCCLGVGALCYQLKTGEELPEDDNGNYEYASLEGEFESVLSWLGLQDYCGRPSGELGLSGGLEALSTLNDDDGYSFEQIAQVLLKHPEAYFLPTGNK